MSYDPEPTMQQLQQYRSPAPKANAQGKVNVLVAPRPRRWSRQRWGLGLAALTILGTMAGAVHQRYGNPSLVGLPLQNETVDGHPWVGEDISFQPVNGHQFNVSFTLNHEGTPTDLMLQEIDLSLMMPTVPTTAQGSGALTQWFLTEREFNRQRVMFKPGSPHIHLPNGLGTYAAEDISIGLTNNCLGAGYWELAVYGHKETGKEKIYQGYFTFSRRAYAGLIAQMNPTSYWQQARTMEAWPGFKFLSGLAFDLSVLRTVQSEQNVPVQDLKSEPILATKEQVDKADLVVYGDGTANKIRTWAELRQSTLQFQSFVKPGIYDPSRLWDSDYSQLAEVTQATARQVVSPLVDQPLTELQLDFANTDGELRQFIVSGIDLAQVPQLESENYAEGIYMPLGFGTPFTQDYAELEENRPEESPFFSVLLDGENQVIDYRKGIGLNGLVLHRDADNGNLLHVYLMSYERITLIGHYIVDLGNGQ